MKTPYFIEKNIIMMISQNVQNLSSIHGVEKSSPFLLFPGGGPNGAYGAGYLSGWSESGTRPTFHIVTGISTGALIAPFAFLGEKYDVKLKEFYTTLSTKDLLKKRFFMAGIASDAVMSSDPLKKIIDTYISLELMNEIAEQEKLGRVLLIGSTNMDALRPVIWNITKIATFGTEEALNLIRDVIYASISIPIVFPPVIINTEAGGNTYEEIHADGGVSSQVFLFPTELDWNSMTESLDLPSKPNLYIICNDRIDPVWKYTESKATDLAARAIFSLIRTQIIGNLDQLYLLSEQNDFNYHATYVPKDFVVESQELFDTTYMHALYNSGYEAGFSRNDWERAPPQFIDAK
jgi:hypothetical protein